MIVIDKSEFKSNLARAAFKWIIANAATNFTTRPYGDLDGRLTGGKGLGVRHALGDVRAVCRRFGLPPLNELIVNKETRRCGTYVKESQGVSARRWAEDVLRCYRFDWTRVFVAE